MLITSCLFQVSTSSESHQIIFTQNKYVTEHCQFMLFQPTSRSRNGSVYVITIHKPFRVTHKSFQSSLPVIKHVFMGMILKQIIGLHKRFTAHNGDQRNACLHELPNTYICESGICSAGTRNVSTKIFCGINRNTHDKNILRNGTMAMFCLWRQCSCSLYFV
jgi:hypothetical protein